MEQKNHVVYVIVRPKESGDPRKYYGVTSRLGRQTPEKRSLLCQKND